MEARHKHLNTEKSFYVEISRARDGEELVTDDREALRERLEMATGEYVSALEGIEKKAEKSPTSEKNRDLEPQPGTPVGETGRSHEAEPQKAPEPKRMEHDLGL